MIRFPRNIQHRSFSEKPVYTIHLKKNNDVFGIHLMQPDETVRTGIPIFMEREDAVFYSRLLENHKNLNKTWPELTREDPRLEFRVSEYMSLGESNRPLEELYINQWDDEEIQDFCIHLCADLMFFHRVEINDNGTLEIFVRVVEHALDSNDYRDKLIFENSEEGIDEI